MDNNGITPSTNDIPSINTIPDLPTVDIPRNEAGTVSVQQAPAAAPVQQTAEVNPAGQIPVQTVPVQYGYAQTAVPAYGQPVVNSKRSAGQIVALIFGVLITVIFGFLFFVFFLGDAVSGFEEPAMSLIIHTITGSFVAFGIFLIVFGAKKKKNAVTTGAVQQQYIAPVQTAPAAQPYAAPVQTAPVAQPYAAPVQTAPTAQPYAAPVQTAPAAQPYATPAPTVSEAVPAPAPTVSEAVPAPAPVDTAAAYDYAPTQVISDDSNEVAKKGARKSALIVMGVDLAVWVVVLILLLGFNYWVFPWYLLFFVAIGAINAIRTYPKSVTAWISLLFSVVTIILFFVINFQLLPYFE